MPTSPLSQLLAQILGTTTPTFEGGPGGPTPTPMAPGQVYPEGGGTLPANPWDYGLYPGDFGFDLFWGSGGYYSQPHAAFFDRATPLGVYTPPAQPLPWEQAGGPLEPYSRLGTVAAMLPPSTAQVWGVPVLPDAFRQHWLELIR